MDLDDKTEGNTMTQDTLFPLATLSAELAGMEDGSNMLTCKLVVISLRRNTLPT